MFKFQGNSEQSTKNQMVCMPILLPSQMHWLREKLSTSPVEIPYLLFSLTQIPILMPTNPSNQLTPPPSHPTTPLIAFFPQTSASLAMWPLVPPFWENSPLGRRSDGGSDAVGSIVMAEHLHSTFLQTNLTFTCSVLAAVGVPSSGATVPACPVEPPGKGFFR